MVITAEQTDKRRYGDSTVYSFNVLVDGVKVKVEPEPEEGPEDRVFGIQIQDGLDQNAALTSFLTKFKMTLMDAPSENDLDSNISV